MVRGRFSVTSPPEDEIPTEEADMLDRYLPADAANTIRKMIRRAQRINPWIQSFTEDFQDLKGKLQQARTELTAAEETILLQTDQIATLQGQAQQAQNAIQNIRQRLTAAGIP